MICPLLAIASTLDKSGNSPCECEKKDCAWWDTTLLKCVLHVIADGIFDLTD